jgi:hypothetical protein
MQHPRKDGYCAMFLDYLIRRFVADEHAADVPTITEKPRSFGRRVQPDIVEPRRKRALHETRRRPRMATSAPTAKPQIRPTPNITHCMGALNFSWCTPATEHGGHEIDRGAGDVKPEPKHQAT